MISLIRGLLLAALTAGLAYAADPTAPLSVEVVASGVTVPPQAVAAGFNTLAFNGNLTSSFDVSCDGSGVHDWYVRTNGTLDASCNDLTWPYNDSGTNVLRIRWTAAAHGNLFGRTGVTTISNDGANGRHFPINAYYECVVRMTPFDEMGPWYNCFMGSKQLTQGTATGFIEYDIMEFHGGDYLGYGGLGGAINFNCMPWTPTCYWSGSTGTYIPDTIPTFDPTQYHKYGMLLKQTSTTNVHFCSYVDDVQFTCGDSILVADEAQQRNILIADATSGCSAGCEGDYSCIQQPITNVANSSGNIRATVGTLVCHQSNYIIHISGVGGVPNANGHFRMVNISGSSFDLQNLDFSTMPAFSGAYTGGGVIGPFTNIDMYVKSFRVWSCASWLTTECFP